MSSQGCVELRARVKILRYEADDAISVVLEPVDGMSLHAWDPGSHIDLILPNGVKRQYSLIGTPDDLRSYEICVHLDASSRGGSEYVHLFLRRNRHHRADRDDRGDRHARDAMAARLRRALERPDGLAGPA